MEKEIVKIDFPKRFWKAELNGVEFKEEQSHIIYIPSLNISSYGDTTEEALEMMKVVARQFFLDLLDLGEVALKKELENLGWIGSKYFKKKLTHLSNTTFEDIKKEFNLPDETTVRNIPIAV